MPTRTTLVLAGDDRFLEHPRQLVCFESVRVLLRYLDPRVAERGLHSHDVVIALAQQTRCEPVPQLMRYEPAHRVAPADTLNHPSTRLLARRLLRIFQPPNALELGHPLVDLNREHVVGELRLQVTERDSQLFKNIRREWEIGPVVTFAENSHLAALAVKPGRN